MNNEVTMCVVYIIDNCVDHVIQGWARDMLVKSYLSSPSSSSSLALSDMAWNIVTIQCMNNEVTMCVVYIIDNCVDHVIQGWARDMLVKSYK